MVNGWQVGIADQLRSGDEYLQDVPRVTDIGALLHGYTSHILARPAGPLDDPRVRAPAGHAAGVRPAGPARPARRRLGRHDVPAGRQPRGGRGAGHRAGAGRRAGRQDDPAVRGAVPRRDLDRRVGGRPVHRRHGDRGAAARAGCRLAARGRPAAGRRPGRAWQAGCCWATGSSCPTAWCCWRPWRWSCACCARGWWGLAFGLAGGAAGGRRVRGRRVLVARTGYQLVVQRYYQDLGTDPAVRLLGVGDLACLVVVGRARCRPRACAGRSSTRAGTGSLRPVAGLVLAAVLAIAVADMSGLSKAEAERIWLPFGVWLPRPRPCCPRRPAGGGSPDRRRPRSWSHHLVLTKW